MDKSCQIVLNSQLQDVTPKIWRHFEINAECTLHDLHEVMQVLYGWANYHMYKFEIEDRRYEKIYPDVDQRDPYDAENYMLRDLLEDVEEFEYHYDFGIPGESVWKFVLFGIIQTATNLIVWRGNVRVHRRILVDHLATMIS